MADKWLSHDMNPDSWAVEILLLNTVLGLSTYCCKRSVKVALKFTLVV